MDSHQMPHIAHPCFWVKKDNQDKDESDAKRQRTGDHPTPNRNIHAYLHIIPVSPPFTVLKAEGNKVLDPTDVEYWTARPEHRRGTL